MFESTRARIATLTLTLWLTSACSTIGDPVNTGASLPDSLVSAEWLSENLGNPSVVVLDCTVLFEQDENGGLRSINGRANFESGHIPTARFADLMGSLSDQTSEHSYTVPHPDQFAAAMEALGVSDTSTVILYDANTSAWAARVWWMLRWIGFDHAAILDGGLDAWTAAGGELTSDTAAVSRGTLTVQLRPHLIVDQEEVLTATREADINIVDALSPEHFRGDISMYPRPGHISGASNLPMFAFYDGDGRHLPLAEQQKLTNLDKSRRTINYCGGGIAASANAFVLTRLGFEDVAVYTGSLQEWAANPSLPMATGDADVAEE